MNGDEVRSTFLEYFRKRGHRVVKSSSLVPSDDPTLLFTNAGMVQFKRIFLGEEKRDYTRAATSQKCVRAGGKHNDLENVGYTARHHTFFEMLGNFSFGDYFKEEAIEMSWDLLTRVFGLPTDKLFASVYEQDEEAYAIWRDKIGVPGDRIVKLGEKDNFWSMGDTGPCGPCSEILIDRGEHLSCGPDCKPGCDCDRYLEVWNLVFMQYNRDESGEMTPLPRPSIDTGMGLERILAVLQDAATNYETDLFAPIFATLRELSGVSLGEDKKKDVSLKVIADHSRAAAFLIGDGVLPGNEGRGYVLRRILRRAIRYGRFLGLTDPFLYRCSATVCAIMQNAYPELMENTAYIQNVVKNEEIRFLETLDNGMKILNEALEGLRASGGNTLSGEVMFKLYDTYGFPVDIVEDVVRGTDIRLDREGFARAMERQRARSRTVQAFSGASEAVRSLSSQGVQTTFTGYTTTRDESKILLLVSSGEKAESVGKGATVEVVTASTPFYGEAGGQVGDSGEIRTDTGTVRVKNTIKDPTGLFIHQGTVAEGEVSEGQEAKLLVDEAARAATAANHTATHLLHAALRAVVGEHAKQSGSLVSPDRLRFDFTHFSALKPGELSAIEAMVNEWVRENLPVQATEMSAEEAQKSGATALFEEKYGDTVRMVDIPGASRELCGGTHTGRTGDIGLFLILSEASVASGVRRIEAVTGREAYQKAASWRENIDSLSRMVKDRPENLPARIEKLQALAKAQEKEIAALKARIASGAGGGETAEPEIKTIKGVQVLVRKVPADSPATLRNTADKMRDKISSGVVVLGAEADGKAFLVAMVTKDLVGRFHAGNIIKHIAKIVGGGGGGRPDMAQAGGSDPSKLAEALEQVYPLIEDQA
ncbi:MAG: alanine--tRNA ligase [Deltaproteobacteria bacterium]|nr:alanine--tRNA ligase [Deltaproteobacteria bacterium]